jgi:hypothetical protein
MRAGKDRRCSGEFGADAECMSTGTEERCSGTTGSISLAPAPRGRSRMHAAHIPGVKHSMYLPQPPPMHGSTGGNRLPTVTSDRSQEFYDAQESQVTAPSHSSRSRSGSNSPESVPQSPRTAPESLWGMHVGVNMHDTKELTYTHRDPVKRWPSNESMHVPVKGNVGSFCTPGSSGAAGGVHPRLQHYESPPSSHPYLHRLAPRSGEPGPVAGAASAANDDVED